MGKYKEPWWEYVNCMFFGTAVTSLVDCDGAPLPRIDPNLLTEMFVQREGRPPRHHDILVVQCWNERLHRLYHVLEIECPCDWKRSFRYVTDY
jgi:hypothetical protein